MGRGEPPGLRAGEQLGQDSSTCGACFWVPGARWGLSPCPPSFTTSPEGPIIPTV